MRCIVMADHLWTGTAVLSQPLLEIEDGRVLAIHSQADGVKLDGAEIHGFPEATLAPTFFDVHFHGAAGHDVMEATPEALSAIGAMLARHGTANFLATTVTAPLDATLRAVEGLASLIQNPGLLPNQEERPIARPVGIHLEGPFLSHAKRGVQPAEHLLMPDIATFDRLFDAAQGLVRLMTLAPELPGAVELTEHATSRGVRVSLGHSNATAAETRAAFAAGAVSATHTFNAMRPLEGRDPGILGAVLSDDRIYSELICDGIHVEPDVVKLWWRAKGPQRGILITDGMSATGMPDGEYQLGGFAVQVANGRATARGVLAGSVLTLDRALSNFVSFSGASVFQGLGMLSANPAAMVGIRDGLGSIAPGQPANFVAVDEAGRLMGTFIEGRPVSN